MEQSSVLHRALSFSGGTKRVADAIAAGFSVPVAQMDLTKADSAFSLGERDGLMAVLPVFAGRAPQIALERLSALKGSGQKAVAVALLISLVIISQKRFSKFMCVMNLIIM